MLIISGLSYEHGTISTRRRFNLAIEMLIISGLKSVSRYLAERTSVSISQSRCLSFQVIVTVGENVIVPVSFQSRNRDACHFRLVLQPTDLRHQPQRFNLAIEMLVISGIKISALRCFVPTFQSRNRDACHFRAQTAGNLYSLHQQVSISQSRCLSFQVSNGCYRERAIQVSISQSRCLSFQVTTAAVTSLLTTFQSRNRDACHFRESRAAVECGAYLEFQSRNRDACHFRTLSMR